uniref:Uncharacterized protein n=1 Tax=Knipowitschia caucasica TaxID=637954 RepID=A0AAV2IZE4_KNICA
MALSSATNGSTKTPEPPPDEEGNERKTISPMDFDQTDACLLHSELQGANKRTRMQLCYILLIGCVHVTSQHPEAVSPPAPPKKVSRK